MRAQSHANSLPSTHPRATHWSRQLASDFVDAFAAAGTVSSLAAYAAAPMQCEPAPVTALAGEPGTKRERTLILVKPDGVERGVVGAVISKFESKGYK